MIDIGGGFPVSYREEMPSIGAIGAVIDDVLGPDHGFRVLAEPGRILTAPCMTLLTSMVGTATRAGQVWHYLDDGLYGSYSPRPLAPVTLARPTCDSVDVIARDYPMPPLAVGDIVVSPLMGAYTAATSSRFNGIPETPVVVSRR